MVLRSCLHLPCLSLSLALCSNSIKAIDKHRHSCGAVRGCMQNAAEVVYEAAGDGACALKGLVQRVRGPFRLLSSQTKLRWRGSLQQDIAALGGKRERGRAAAALQTCSPAGEGYLSHIDSSPGCPIPSTHCHLWENGRTDLILACALMSVSQKTVFLTIRAEITNIYREASNLKQIYQSKNT